MGQINPKKIQQFQTLPIIRHTNDSWPSLAQVMTNELMNSEVAEVFHEFNISAMLDLSCCRLTRLFLINWQMGQLDMVPPIINQQVFDPMFLSVIIVRQGDGETAWEAILQRVAYIGVCFTEDHVTWQCLAVSLNKNNAFNSILSQSLNAVPLRYR